MKKTTLNCGVWTRLAFGLKNDYSVGWLGRSFTQKTKKKPKNNKIKDDLQPMLDGMLPANDLAATEDSATTDNQRERERERKPERKRERVCVCVSESNKFYSPIPVVK